MKNLVLIGMSGCGKSTVGKLIAQNIGMKYIDTDELVEKKAGKSINEIFAQNGEEYFRKLEREMCLLAASLDGAVIATGGGVVKNAEIMQSLEHCTVVFIKRDIEDIIATADSSVRPLFTNPDAVRKLYAQREELYKKYSHFEVLNQSVEQCAKEIIKIISK